ncbi:PTS transporter subunit EIIC [Spiroplasma endosymbiont of Crioceris asparagi]|uniref:PTS transporter subunit EIIC n=1 Tax=Spiroplasma endosymbiont of Crioceris asparagi TaxID=3066286 RepID=UPI0030D46146
MKNNKVEITEAILKEINYQSIVSWTHCMTRLRLKVNNSDAINDENIRNINGVLGLIKNSDSYQIILGPGKVNEVYDEFVKQINQLKVAETEKTFNNNEASLDQIAFDTKVRYRQKGKNNKIKNSVMNFLGNISQIFSPVLPAFIGAGLLQAMGTIILTSFNNNPSVAGSQWITLLTSFFAITLQILTTIIGWKTAEIYGGSPILGALIGAMYGPFAGNIMGNLYKGDLTIGGNGGTFLGINVHNIGGNWFTVGIFSKSSDMKTWVSNGLHGSLFGALIGAIIAAKLEKQYNRFIPNQLKIFLVPLMVLISMLAIQIILLIPTSGYLFSGLEAIFENVTKNSWVLLVCGTLLAGIWLIAVVFGIHQGATPIYVMLIQTQGINVLFPILAMAGASQVGSALALYVRAQKGSNLRKQIASTIVPGFLGIGEPIIYGVTLPRVKPFITSCIGACVGGLFFGILAIMNINVGCTALGPSGLMAIPLMSATGVVPQWTGYLFYLMGLVLTYGAGFVITYLFGWKGVNLK